MSETLKPCPVCGGADFWHAVGDVVQCDTEGCTFACSKAYWNDWPRWVSVDERLPTEGLVFFALEGKHALQCHVYLSEDNEWFNETERPVSNVTHWLDGIPSVPDA